MSSALRNPTPTTPYLQSRNTWRLVACIITPVLTVAVYFAYTRGRADGATAMPQLADSTQPIHQDLSRRDIDQAARNLRLDQIMNASEQIAVYTRLVDTTPDAWYAAAGLRTYRLTQLHAIGSTDNDTIRTILADDLVFFGTTDKTIGISALSTDATTIYENELGVIAATYQSDGSPESDELADILRAQAGIKSP